MVKQKGFTLIEALVVSGIIVMMLALVLPNFRLGERQFGLRLAAGKLVQDLRTAQGLSMSAAAFSCPEGRNLRGYGLVLESSALDSYKLMAKCGTDEVLKENIDLENNIKIKELKKDGQPASLLKVFFYPPDPQTDLGGADGVEIILNSADAELSVRVNKAGLINVE